ncbi:hypothetical protein DVH24_003196 [Malus domestica]|uniref:Uncharacterized protein n=1 Tax=Malus domestica TaxID=3750 RepID=A0A498IGH2_MALDO|nr:hypothetical protein DVH24_003196 [Malus domestica]
MSNPNAEFNGSCIHQNDQNSTTKLGSVGVPLFLSLSPSLLPFAAFSPASWFDLPSSHPTGVSPPPSSNFQFLVKFDLDLWLVKSVSSDLVLLLGRMFQTPSLRQCCSWISTRFFHFAASSLLELVDGIAEARLGWGMGFVRIDMHCCSNVGSDGGCSEPLVFFSFLFSWVPTFGWALFWFLWKVPFCFVYM